MAEFDGLKTQLTIFSDFDGTISTLDVGNRLFHHFTQGRSEEPVRLWRADQIDARQCLVDEAALMRETSESELYDYIDSFQIDSGFSSFAEWCRIRNLPLFILSDGLDLYIERLLRREGLSDLPIFANQGHLENGRLSISFPYHTEGCGRCGNCKGFHLRRLRRKGCKNVYIGDGKSDLCALPEADIVFAKGFLADYCRQNGIDFEPFDDFTSLVRQLTDKFV